MTTETLLKLKPGDRVSIAPFTCQGRTIRPWHGKAGILQRVELGTAYVDFGVPGHPYPCAAKHLLGPTEAAEKPKQSEAGETLCEWRWWPSTKRWTYTGRMGLDIKPSHPNSEVFPHGVDPNKEAQRA